MAAHAIDLETQVATNGRFRYRWRCSCGLHGKRWYAPVEYESGSYARACRSARTGGARHAAAMERGR